MKYLLALFCFLVGGAAVADDNVARHGFWGDIDIGFGSLDMKPDVADSSTGTRFYFAFAGGYTVHPQLQLGIEAGGWNIKSGSLWDSSKGEGLMQLFAVARYWPSPNSKLFIKLAGGNVTHWNNAPGTTKGTGSGYTVGIGYEFASFADAQTCWFLNYGAGGVSGYTPPGGVKQGEDYSAVTAGLSVGF